MNKLDTRLGWTGDATFITIEVNHDGSASTTAIFNAAANRLNESSFRDWCITKIEHKDTVSYFTCEP